MNPYALIRRTEKADKLVAVLREQKITAATVREVGLDAEEFWAAAAFSANVRPPSRITRQMVLEELERP